MTYSRKDTSMKTRLVNLRDRQYVECLPDDQLMNTEADVLDLVAACGEHGCDRLMIHACNLPQTFYDLKTGLVGVMFLKFSNYRIKCAAVLTPELVGNGRFAEMVWEENRGRQFHVFYDRDSAEKWLVE